MDPTLADFHDLPRRVLWLNAAACEFGAGEAVDAYDCNGATIYRIQIGDRQVVDIPAADTFRPNHIDSLRGDEAVAFLRRVWTAAQENDVFRARRVA